VTQLRVTNQGCQSFLGTTYQKVEKYIQHDHKAYLSAIKYAQMAIRIHFLFQGLPKYSPIRIFGIKNVPIWQPCRQLKSNCQISSGYVKGADFLAPKIKMSLPFCKTAISFVQAGLTDFSWDMIPKPGKMYQMNTKCTNWP
jgi:hypothetical protein